jgi:hypothetical protein
MECRDQRSAGDGGGTFHSQWPRSTEGTVNVNLKYSFLACFVGACLVSALAEDPPTAPANTALNFFHWMAGTWEVRQQYTIEQVASVDPNPSAVEALKREYPDGLVTRLASYEYLLSGSGRRLLRIDTSARDPSPGFSLEMWSAGDAPGLFAIWQIAMRMGRDAAAHRTEVVRLHGQAVPKGNAMMMGPGLPKPRVWLREGSDTLRVVLAQEHPDEVLSGTRPGVDIGVRTAWTRVKAADGSSPAKTPEAQTPKAMVLLMEWAGEWAAEAGISTRHPAASGALSLVPSASQRYLLGEYSLHTNRMDVFKARDEVPFLVWLQVTEDRNAVGGVSVVDLVGTLADDHKTVWWKHQGRTVELWRWPDADTLIRMAPSETARVDVGQAVLVAKYRRRRPR